MYQVRMDAEILVLVVVACVFFLVISSAAAALYYFYFYDSSPAPAPAPAVILAPKSETAVITPPPGVPPPSKPGEVAVPPSKPGETPSGPAWNDFQMLLGPGTWRLGDGANFRVAKGSDGMSYFYHKDSDPARLLAFLEPCMKQMPALAAQLAKNLGSTDPRVVKFETWLGTMRIWKTSCVVIYEPPYPGSDTAGAFQMGNWCIMGGTWFNDECTNPSRGNYKSCIGSVLHEIAHLICAPVPPHGCVGHGSGFCRLSAELLKAAEEIGMFVPYQVPGAWTWFTVENFKKIDRMRNVRPYEDGECDNYI
jgi:hypothetical protein